MIRFILILLAAVSLGACNGDEQTVSSNVLRPPVMIEAVIRRDVFDRIDATGQLIAKAEATVAAQVDGVVTEIRALEGAAVETSDVLLVIDPERRELEVARGKAELSEARAELSVASRNLSRTKRLSKGNVASEARLDEDRTRQAMAQSSLTGAEARLGLAQRALEDATVRAPFSGMVARRHVSVGEYLSVGTPLFELVALDPIEVEFTLAEIDSSRVALGFPVEISIAPYPDEVFMASVSMISPTIDPRTRTLRVKAELPNPDGRIRPGLFARADLGVSERLGALIVPVDAVLQRADGAVVFRLGEDERVERIQVKTRTHGEGWVEIEGGLRPTDKVVVRGHARLEDGIFVSVRNPDGSLLDAPEAAPAPASETLAEDNGEENAS